jgi:Protein of unknown function (DUF3179)
MSKRASLDKLFSVSSIAQPQLKKRGKLAALAFFLCVLLALGCFAIPMYVIRPFRAQSSGSLNFALHVIAWSAWLAPLCAAIALLLGVALWLRGPGKLRRTGIVFGLVLAALALAATRVNIYERMFHPDPNPHFLPPAQAWVGDEDMVMAVRIGGQSRAYPIRQMGYHHVINDVVGGQPIVATY